ncbi:hypothetical protein FACS1894147_10460 [Spirochaetia bacterium]|nr:hypothetical protein FACS1894147_10460 [Spirochaetia bacterium]
MSNDYIPAKDEEFNAFSGNLAGQLAANGVAWVIPAVAITELGVTAGPWNSAWTACLAPNHGKLDILTKNGARKIHEAAMRIFFKRYIIYNSAMSDADKESTGYPPSDTTRTASTAPRTRPEADVTYAPAQLSFHFKDEGSEKRGKPQGAHCMELKWDFCEDITTITDVVQLARSDAASASPLVLTCIQGEREKQIVYFLRWEGERSTLKGPWAGPFTAVFP